MASPGLILKWQPGQAIYIRRYVSGAAAAAAANLILYFHGSLEVQTGSQPFSVGSGNGSNDSEMLSGDPSPSVANAQTLSDISITAMLRDDWHEFDDYINPVAGVGLGLQCFWRLRNVDAAAHNVTVVDSVLLEIWQSESALLGDARA